MPVLDRLYRSFEGQPAPIRAFSVRAVGIPAHDTLEMASLIRKRATRAYHK
jgi:hypothetical protein